MSIRHIVQTSIVTAFIIAAALIWKDFFDEIFKIIFPATDQVFYKFLGAVFSTLLVIIAIYLTLKTEEEAEYVVKIFKKKKSKRNNL